MSIGAGVVRAVALQQIDNAPNTEARAQRDNKGLQSGDSGCEKCHKDIRNPNPRNALFCRFVTIRAEHKP